MKNILSFYFDGALVQAVKATVSGNSITVADARAFPFEELDAYLSHCREKSCVVSCNPLHFYQDIIHLPPAAEKIHGKLLHTEIRKLHPDLVSFSIFHRTIGESTIDSKPYSKIVAFSYPDDFLSLFITAANRRGMAISHVYPAPGPIFKLALSTCATAPDQPRIFIATLPGEKLIMVSENNELEFIRKIPSLDNALLPEDTNNINMTVDYCFQTLRVRPVEAVMLNQPELSGELSHLVSVPYRQFLPPHLKELPSHIIQDYLAPVAAALHSVQAPRLGDIQPSGYAAFTQQKRLLTATAMVMFLLTLLLSWYLIREQQAISALKTSISRIRTELSGSANELATFRTLDAEINRLKQPLEAVNKHNTSRNPAGALAALTLPDSREYLLKGVTVQSGSSGIDVQIQGTIRAAGYSDTQALFEGFVARLAKLPGYSVVSSTIDIKLKTFSIQARYVNGGEPAK